MELNISGIKCDNRRINCQWRDDSVKWEDYEAWVDRPCPVCGENLLTRRSYERWKRVVGVAKTLHRLRWLNPFFYINWLTKAPRTVVSVFTRNGEEPIVTFEDEERDK